MPPQLVFDSVTDAEMPAFDKLLARADPRPEEEGLLRKVQASLELCNARGRIMISSLLSPSLNMVFCE